MRPQIPLFWFYQALMSILLTALIPFSALGENRDSCEVSLKKPRTVTKIEFKQIQKITDQVQAQYPPDQYVYLGVGQSPTPFLALLQARGLDTINLPLSGLRARQKDRSQTETHALSSELKKKLMRHFDHFLSDDVIKGRKILVFDYVLSGASLVAVKDYLDLFRTTRPEFSFSYLALIDRTYEGKRDKGVGSIPQLNITAQREVSSRLSGQLYDLYSQFGSFDLRRDQSTLVSPNALYYELVDDFKTREGR